MGRTRCSHRSAFRSRDGPEAPASSREDAAPLEPGSSAASPEPGGTGSVVTGGTAGSSGQPGRTTPDYTPPYAIVPVVDANQPRAAPAASPIDPPAPSASGGSKRSAGSSSRSSSSSPPRSSPGSLASSRRGRVQPVRHRPARSRGDPQRARFRAAPRSSMTGRRGRARPVGLLRREVIAFDAIPGDASMQRPRSRTAFWTNPGFDPLGILSAGIDTISGRPRGARRSPSSSSATACSPTGHSRARRTSASCARSSSPPSSPRPIPVRKARRRSSPRT